jgi:hypothetical protein
MGAMAALRPVFARKATWLWFCLGCTAFALRSDLLGVAGLVRALGLGQSQYEALRRLFHSKAFRPDTLARAWTRHVLGLLAGRLVEARGMAVFALDGVKAPKSGRRMPSVKRLRQPSASNTKPEYIDGHSFQALSVLARGAGGALAAVPLCAGIHEGLKLRKGDARTLFDKAVAMLAAVLPRKTPFLLVADALYGCGKMATGCLRLGGHLLTRLKANAVAWTPAPSPPPGAVRRGRPKLYGRKVRLADEFSARRGWRTASILLYGRTRRVRLRSRVLMWRPAGIPVLYVFAALDDGSRALFMTTCQDLQPVEVVRLYAMRFKIEVGFKADKHVLGTFAYRFWMGGMDPLPRNPSTQDISSKPPSYVAAVRRKMRTYHAWVQTALVARGLMLCASLLHAPSILRRAPWMRTLPGGSRAPSEWTVCHVLRTTFPDFLADAKETCAWAKFIADETTSAHLPPAA